MSSLSLLMHHSLLLQRADVAQLVEHVLGKDGVSGSIPLIGSRDYKAKDIACR